MKDNNNGKRLNLSLIGEQTYKIWSDLLFLSFKSEKLAHQVCWLKYGRWLEKAGLNWLEAFSVVVVLHASWLVLPQGNSFWKQWWYVNVHTKNVEILKIFIEIYSLIMWELLFRSTWRVQLPYLSQHTWLAKLLFLEFKNCGCSRNFCYKSIS